MASYKKEEKLHRIFLLSNDIQISGQTAENTLLFHIAAERPTLHSQSFYHDELVDEETAGKLPLPLNLIFITIDISLLKEVK